MQVVSGKTAGIIARQTLAMARRARKMSDAIKVKTAETIQVTGKTLKIKRLRSELKKALWQRSVMFTRFGKAVFKLVKEKAGNIWQRKEVKGFLQELGKCEAEIEWIKAQISEIEERSREQNNYRKAILNLSSKEKGVRLAALKSLERLGEKDSVPILIKRLEDPDLSVRGEAARVLRKIIDRAYL